MDSSPAYQVEPHLVGFIPEVSPTLTQLYEQALRQNQLIAGCCKDCRHTAFPPAPRCSVCHSERVEPMRLSGRGMLHAAEIGRHADALSIGSILLEEGLWVRALLVGDFQEPATLEGQLRHAPLRVKPAVLRTQGIAILAFGPEDSSLRERV